MLSAAIETVRLSSSAALDSASKVRHLVHIAHTAPTANVSDSTTCKAVHSRLATLQESLVDVQKAHTVKVAELSQVSVVCKEANKKLFDCSVGNHIFAWVIGVPVAPSLTKTVGGPLCLNL